MCGLGFFFLANLHLLPIEQELNKNALSHQFKSNHLCVQDMLAGKYLQ